VEANMGYTYPYYGEKTTIGCSWEEEWGPDTDFTIDSATVTIKPKGGGTAIRDGVSATVDGVNVYYQDTFNAANGYEEGGIYTATFEVNITIGSSTYIEKHQDSFKVMMVADE